MKSPFKNLISDAAIITALATFYGYLIAYYYERGYITYFGLPAYYTNVSLLNIFHPITLLIPTVFLIMIMCAIYLVIVDRKIPLWQKISTILFLVLPGSYVLGNKFDLFDLVFAVSIALLFVQILNVIQWSLQNNSETKENQKIFRQFDLDIGLHGFIYISFIFYTHLAVVLLASLVGNKEAANQKEFHTLRYENQDFIVVREHNDRIVAVPFDKRKKTFSRQFILINSSELVAKKIPITISKVGQLQSGE